MRRKPVKNRFAPVVFGRTVYDEIWHTRKFADVLKGGLFRLREGGSFAAPIEQKSPLLDFVKPSQPPAPNSVR